MINYKIDSSQGIIYATVSESTSTDEIVTHIQYLQNDPHFQPHYHTIVNVEKKAVVEAKLPDETETMQNVLIGYAEKRKGSKYAIVFESETTREMVSYGLDLIEYVSSDVQIFSSIDDALQWINSSG
jgi:hypothetical protein